LKKSRDSAATIILEQLIQSRRALLRRNARHRIGQRE
jgi:hypothetical protein